jgi:maltokinase
VSSDQVGVPELTAAARTGLETALASWVPRQRWCAVPAATACRARILAVSTLSSPEVLLRHLVVALDPVAPDGAADAAADPAAATNADGAVAGWPDGQAQVYQVPVVAYVEPQESLGRVLVGDIEGRFVYDALHDREAAGLLLELLASGTPLGHLVPSAIPGATLPLGEPSLVIGTEQSNTSLVYGGAAIVKFFRRLWPGENPDIEVSAALTAAGSQAVPPLLASMTGSWPDPETGVVDSPAGSADTVTGGLAMASEFLRTATDGWELALGSVRDLLAEEDLHADEVGGDFAGEAHRLGEATARVHGALAEHLPTAILDAPGVAALAETLRARLIRAAAAVPALESLVDALGAIYDELGARSGSVAVQRVHGDFHLGQTVRTSKGWRLLDFEGEPARPIADRVVLDSPLRDVAGMLRSLDYASRQPLIGEPDNHQLTYRATEWRERNSTAFCEGYVEAGGLDMRGEDVLMRAYEVDKAVYEAVYENNYRPSWLPVPLAALRRLAGERMTGEGGR